MFYHDIHALLGRTIQINKRVEYIEYDEFDGIKEIAAGGYGTVSTARYSAKKRTPETVVLKRFKRFHETPELFISEVSKSLILLFIN